MMEVFFSDIVVKMIPADVKANKNKDLVTTSYKFL